MFKFLVAVIVCSAPFCAFGLTCDAGYFVSNRNHSCLSCQDWGQGYTSDAGATELKQCYTICDDGTRVYWPNTCDASVCAIGAYMKNDVCTACESAMYCPGDNMRHSCLELLPDNSRTPDVLYTLGFGNDLYRYGYTARDCYCMWNFDCANERNDPSCSTCTVAALCSHGPVRDCIIIDKANCNPGYFPDGYPTQGPNYKRCSPCTNTPPENAEYTGIGTSNDLGGTGDDCPWVCNSGLGRTAADTCAPLCGAGITTLNTSTGVRVPLFAVANTSPAIHIKNKNGICHADLIQGTSENAIHIRYNGITYHTTNDNK